MLAYEISGFVRKIVTFPDLEVVFGMAEVVDGLGRELQLSEPGQLLLYDTTFQLGKLNFHYNPLQVYDLQGRALYLHTIPNTRKKFTSMHAPFFSELSQQYRGPGYPL